MEARHSVHGRLVLLVCTVAAAGIIGGTKDAASQEQASPQYPDLTRLHNPALTSAQRLELGLSFVKQLSALPPPPGMVYTRGPIDPNYTRSQAFHALGREVTVADLTAARNNVTDPTLWDGLTIALGYAGEESVIEELQRIAFQQPDDWLRAKAVGALAGYADPQLWNTFSGLLADPFVLASWHDPIGAPSVPCKFYPVRAEAGTGLLKLGLRVPESVYRLRVEAVDDAELYSRMLEDKVPHSCLIGVAYLGRIGDKGLPYLQRFVDENAGNKALEASMMAAREILAKGHPAGK